MKTTIILLLCGIAYCSASPRCSKEAFAECNPSFEEESEVLSILTVEQLDRTCRYRNSVVKCQMDFIDRCPNVISEGKKDFIEEFDRMFGGFCKEPLRTKLLNNVRCLNRVIEEVPSTCRLGDINKFDSGYCKELKRALKCIQQLFEKECGGDAGEVYSYIQNPESFLRKVNCL